MASELQAGVARREITPEGEVPMAGFAGRGPATGIHDPLKLTVAAFRDGGTTALIFGFDLISVGEDVSAWRERVTEKLGVPGENQLFNASHTHYGPNLKRDNPLIETFLTQLGDAVVEAAEEAVAALAPVIVGYAADEMTIGVNRREWRDGIIVLGQNPAGANDPSVLVARFDRVDGTPLLALVNASCHPVSGSSMTREISADWPGVARDLFEAETGATMLFLQGASANINPLLMAAGHESAKSSGESAAPAVIRAWRAATPGPAEGLACAGRRVELPRYRYRSEEEARRVMAEQEKNLTADRPATREWAEYQLELVREVVDSYDTGRPVTPLGAELCGWRLGPLALAAAPGEIFCEIGQAVKTRSPLQPTLFAAYSNGAIGYVPTPESYPDGGYEVERACRVDPPAAGIIEEGCLACLAEVAG